MGTYPPRITLEQGTRFLQTEGFDRFKSILVSNNSTNRDDYRQAYSSEEYSTLYTTVYTMCTQRPPYNYSEHLLQFVKDESAKVAYLFPPGSIKREAWVDFFFHVFRYLDRFYVKRNFLDDLNTVIHKAMSQRDDVRARKKRQLSRIPAVIGLIAYWRHLAAMPGAAGMHTAAASFEAAAAME